MSEVWTIDCIGVVFSVESPITIRLWSGGEKRKRTVTFGDDSEKPNGMCINLCFWGDLCDVEIDIGDVLAFKKIRVSEFSGKSLNTVEETEVVKNPDTKRAEILWAWFSTLKGFETATGVSTKLEPGIGWSGDSVRLIGEINDYVSTSFNPNHPGFFIVNAMVTFLKTEERTTYLACPECKRKVTQEDMGEGVWCDHCWKQYPQGVYTYMLLAKIGDSSGELFVHFYWNNAEPIMGGMPADEFEKMKRMYASEPEAFIHLMN